MPIVSAEASSWVNVSVSATARLRTNYAIVHLIAAAQFSRQAGEIEIAHKNDLLGEWWDDLRHNSIACLLLTTACLIADHRRGIVREYPGHRRKVADIAVEDAEERDDRGLVGGDRIEVAHLLTERQETPIQAGSGQTRA
jgi:hypothetical protein